MEGWLIINSANPLNATETRLSREALGDFARAQIEHGFLTIEDWSRIAAESDPRSSNSLAYHYWGILHGDMSCGAPIKSGFFCARCQSGEEPAKKDDGWKGSRFTGDAKKKKQHDLLMEDLGRWGKRLMIVLIIVGVGFGVKTLFGARIVTWHC